MMISQLDHFPVDQSVARFFSSVENLLFERQHNVVRLPHLARCVAAHPVLARALLGSAHSPGNVREIIVRADAVLREIADEDLSPYLALHDSVCTVLRHGLLEAQRWGAAAITIDHFVRALLHDAQFCNQFVPLDERQWRQADAEARACLESRRTTVITHTPFLDRHSRNLTQLVRNGELAWPIRGRDRELVRLLRILLRRTGRNPLLVGAAGVGKTAMLTGLAESLLARANFSQFRVSELNLTSLIAGTDHRGELELRVHKILKELRENPSVVVAIDELCTPYAGGPGASASCVEFLMPALAEGDLRLIGVTNQENVERLLRDPAIRRRFEPVVLQPLDAATVREVLADVRASLIAHYKSQLGVNLIIPDDVLAEIPAAATQAVPGRTEPDASIALMQDLVAAAILPADGGVEFHSQAQVVVTKAILDEVADTLHRTADQLARIAAESLLSPYPGPAQRPTVGTRVKPRPAPR